MVFRKPKQVMQFFCLGQFFPSGKGAMRLTLYEAPTYSTRQGQTTTPGSTCPTFFDKCVGSFMSPANHVYNTEDAGDRAYGL